MKSVETIKDVALQHKYYCRATSLLNEDKMDKILKSIYCFMESMGRARAASVLARQGNYKMAQQLMMEKSSCCNG